MDKFSTMIEIPVQWGDMDAAQHVNNVVYLKWMEAARVAHFVKLNGDGIKSGDIGPILAWQECKYISPVVFPDTVMVGIRVSETRDDRLITETKIYRKSDMSLVAIGRQMVVAYDFNTRSKAPLPQAWTK